MSKKYGLCRNVMAMVVAAAVMMPALASAEWYAGVSAGKTKAEDLSADDLGSPDFTNKDSGWKVFAGYEFNENVAVEFAHQDLGTTRWSGGGSYIDAAAKAMDIAVVGSLPFGTGWALQGKIGFSNWDVDTSSNFATTEDESGSDTMYGFGVRYYLSKACDLRLEYEIFKVGDELSTDVSHISFGIAGHF